MVVKKITQEIFDPHNTKASCVDAVLELEENLREQDRIDLKATGEDLGFMIIKSIQLSDVVYFYRGEKGELLCVLGIGPISLESPGRSVWMLGTNAIVDGGYVKDLLFKEARKMINYWADKAGLLHNVVYAKNKRSIAYLTRLGAVWLPETIVCTDDTEWCKFYITGKGGTN